MPLSTPIPIHKFLIDENVRRELAEFLKKKGFNVKLASKGSPDSQLAVLSKSEKRIVVTNDEQDLRTNVADFGMFYH